MVRVGSTGIVGELVVVSCAKTEPFWVGEALTGLVTVIVSVSVGFSVGRAGVVVMEGGSSAGAPVVWPANAGWEGPCPIATASNPKARASSDELPSASVC